MRFLIDAQLPPALARYLVSLGHQADHVNDVGLERVADPAIWKRAAETGAILVSKDEDFALMRIWDPAGPQIIWVRIGNATRREVIARFSSALPDLLASIARGEKLVELTD